ncbi:hypothetical protein MNBD_PLANCTO02-3174 [hydrothermal vent metagenome]|uniref:LamG-like jellyroll fold domain-containing protein n=1 Tax=hydrothermal vent metagenome TaxID=652676 RepID=A0A3B1E0R2_9ZZZZ
MIKRLTCFCFLFILSLNSLVISAEKKVPLQEPWKEKYTQKNAGGKHVIGIWTFDGKNPGADISGHGHTAKFDGATIEKQGKFGSAMRSFPGYPVQNKQHWARVRNHPALSPKGAFTLEMWVKPTKKGILLNQTLFLLDKKYIDHADYQLLFGTTASKSGVRTLQATLGFGTFSKTWYSAPVKLEAEKWLHIIFTYDAAGTGTFYFNGIIHGRTKLNGVGQIAPGNRLLTIGDRNGSNYAGFPGLIDQVRISNGILEFRPVRFDRVTMRSNYVRMEKTPHIQFHVTNLQQSPLAKAILTWKLNGLVQGTSTVRHLLPGKSQIVQFPLNTTLRPDKYRLTVELSTLGANPVQSVEHFPLQIVSRKLPDQFPVVMWGAGLGSIDQLKKIGFTHAYGFTANNGKIFREGKPTLSESKERVAIIKQGLDDALAKDISFYASVSPGAYLRKSPQKNSRLMRVGRNKKQYKTGHADICPLIPDVKKYAYNVGASIAQTYHDYPAFDAGLIHSEVKGASRPCFHSHDIAAFKKYSGLDNIPAEAGHPRGVNYKRIKNFPKSRIVPDNYPLYLYYKWYWKNGIGWNDLNSDVDRGLKSTGKKLWTWHDPAMRVSSVYGSGGNVDVISQWTYCYPDPLRINVSTDELFAMAKGAGRKQDVMKMTQIIWYRSQTAPSSKKKTRKKNNSAPKYEARWEREQPDTSFITISPMHLREAFWAKISRPIKGIMYHGWQSLVPAKKISGYRYTHTQTQHELSRIIHDVVQPLGPTLKKIPAAKNDIAFYESFAAQCLANRGTYGWNGGWAGDAHLITQWAGLQTDVLYDETIMQQGLSNYKILFMMHADVLTESIAKKIKAFQRRGGIVVADEFAPSAIVADIVIRSYKRTGKADIDKKELQKLAVKLKKRLARKYRNKLTSSNMNVVPYLRQSGKSDYIFVVNDHREFGNYVGHHRRVMENGLPSISTISLNRISGVMYDLVEHHQVKVRTSAGKLSSKVHLGPCDGRLFLVVPQPINQVVVNSPETVKQGEQIEVSLKVVDAAGQPVPAIIPVEISIEDSEGRKAEFSGFRATTNGQIKFKINVASNDKAGAWSVHVRELASGKTGTCYFQVKDTKFYSRSHIKIDGFNPVQPDG